MATRVQPVHRVSPGERSTPQLVADLSEQLTHLVRTEMRLAQREMRERGKEAGKGAAALGAAGVFALLGGATLVATAVLLLSLVLDAWLAALIVSVALLLVSGVAALVGRSRLRRAAPAVPERTMGEVREDIELVKEAGRR
ncbi:putative superfamily III holin-X [Saccharopolyspora erythraea NRRL 2338]|uniref:Integral membrane protein n=2 Tax=Saccharopolyspora erythraea TaxID=1836 RepID=A4FHA0_SACEN|nr:phage holin family protein [Saccharopolyspora erythraea]EQD86835.1 membrane protein [Saccharopolyspora erythraea D]PFG97125.1 putative superfamily III holin-X [Saccharopolyspora erythraea NRRL 2338]QRK87328.1 phage holin family protein [Saccharopolyspora erythraea]CAM03425.1 integral membrane protein [Saccharopolyspora erythraea NRRL 2338]